MPTQKFSQGIDLTGSGVRVGVRAITASDTLRVSDHLVLVDATAGAVTVTLPAAASLGPGFTYEVRKIDASANAVTIDGNSSETIDGALTQVITTRWGGVGLVVATGADQWYSRTPIDASLGRENLLVNPGLERWQRGAGAFTATGAYTADRWVISLQGASTISVTQDSTHQDAGSKYCAALAFTMNVTSFFYQQLEDYTQLQGKVVTFSARLRTATAAAATISVYDGVTRTAAASFHTGGGAYETLSVIALVSASASVFQVEVQIGATSTVYVDNTTLVVGSTALPYTPLTAADDFSRCIRYYEVFVVNAAGDTFGNGNVVATNRLWVSSRFTEKPVVPTVTVSTASNFRAVYGAFSTAAAGSITPSSVNKFSMGLDVNSVTGSPLTVGQACYLDAANTSAKITIEASP